MRETKKRRRSAVRKMTRWKTKAVSVLLALALGGEMFSASALAAGTAVNAGTIEETEADPEDEEETGLPDGFSVGEDGSLIITIGDREWTFEEKETAKQIGTVTGVSSLNVRSGPGMDYAVVGLLSAGSTVEVTGEEGSWYEVAFGSQTGYVNSRYLDVVEVTEESSNGMDEALLMLMMALFCQTAAEGDSDEEKDTSLALTPEGNLTLVDDIDPTAAGTESTAGKQFITVQTRSGNYFYLIIDRDDEGENTVHFLNQVDEADLLSLMDEEDVEAYESAAAAAAAENSSNIPAGGALSMSGSIADSTAGTAAGETAGDAGKEDASGTAGSGTAEAENTETAQSGDESGTGSTEEGEGNEEETGRKVGLLLMVVVVIALAAVIGVLAFRKLKPQKEEAVRSDPDADYESDEEDEEENRKEPDDELEPFVEYDDDEEESDAADRDLGGDEPV